MAKKFDLVVKVGERDGKPIWKNCGAMMENDRGPYIIMDATFNPAGAQQKNGSVFISLFEPRSKNEPLFPDAPTDNYANDEVPF